ncbi:MAG TPA: hypothetical protein VF683_10840, partial [Chthoniobacterales bacterium]
EWQGEGNVPAITVAQTSEGTSAAMLAAEAVAHLPPARRTPYLHFIVDRSTAAKMSDEQIVSAMRNAGARIPAAKECLITSANYETRDLVSELTPIDSLAPALLETRDDLPRRGGFLAERAMKLALLGYRDRLADAGPPARWQETFPVLVLVSDQSTTFAFDPDLLRFADLAPDTDLFYVANAEGAVNPFDYTGRAAGDEQGLHPVALLRLGGAVSPCRLEPAEPRLVAFAKTSDDTALNVFREGKFEPLPAEVITPEAPYNRAVAAWQQYLRLVHDPSLGAPGLADVVKASRATGVLTPSTSYIVVENSAQWKMLERKERQKLGGPNALEFEEVQVPEPGTTAVYLLVSIGALLAAHRRCSRSASCS